MYIYMFKFIFKYHDLDLNVRFFILPDETAGGFLFRILRGMTIPELDNTNQNEGIWPLPSLATPLIFATTNLPPKTARTWARYSTRSLKFDKF